MSNPKSEPTEGFFPREQVTDLIRELAVKPPVKGMANVKAATDVFEANHDPVGRVEANQPIGDTTQRR